MRECEILPVYSMGWRGECCSCDISHFWRPAWEIQEFQMGRARDDHFDNLLAAVSCATVSVLHAVITPGAGATPIFALCTHRIFLSDAPPCLSCDSCCKGCGANDRGYRASIASSAIPTNGCRPPQAKVPAQHRGVGAYRLWKDHAHGTNSVLYGADTRYS